ncbi:restriction endonuclease [Streptomyces albipurpureus]|uniref:Restriction endonuclease n=1 Tax=Streptomyces albipurpureus TaxID=2897419 RepID=A0ABT0UZJ6_9ACTN|nr:restriction endonuclease [Streptomyces sp. CWNU-1]MCM2393842.1 restriction endonuclease [Streptomyces sp. CWNU-1]
MRQTVLAFGLAAAVICGAGLLLKSLLQAAGQQRLFGPVVLVGGALLLALWIRSRRRVGPRRGVDPHSYHPEPYSERPPAPLGPEHPVALSPEPAPPAPVEPEVTPAEQEGEVLAAEPGDFGAMDPEAFEVAIAALCERDGCRDIEVTGGAGDLGADVVATAPDGRRVIIQCKRYGPVNKVGSGDMQRFGGTCFSVHEAQVAAVVTTGEFTQPALEYAEQCGIVCVDHHALTAWARGEGAAPW